jgi:hypothetical protein
VKAELVEQHAWLRQFVGDWRSEMPGMEGGTHVGTETVTMLGDNWVVFDGVGPMPDGPPMRMRMTLGYDPAQQAFVGSWIGSMMNHSWIYRGGTLDAARRLLTLPCEGPAFDGSGRIVQYRDEIEVVNADERLLHGNQQGEDGRWTRFMTARYTRIK